MLSKKKISLLLLSAGITGAIFMNGNLVDAHGYVKSPPSRGYQGQLDKENPAIGYNAAMELYGPIIHEPQSLEAPKGFPKAGPADGRIASANRSFGDKLDQQTASIWKKQNIKTGPLNITWNYTQSHKTTKWHYYITKPGWNQNGPLSRKDLEEIAVINHGGAQAETKPTHQVNIPKDRLGYHVIVAIWDIDDTSNAFYNTIDVNVTTDSAIPTNPATPTGLKQTSVTATTATLGWNAQSDAASYNIYRDEKLIKTVSNVSFTDSGLKPKTTYKYQIQAVGNTGLVSSKSSTLTITTNSESAVELPTVPANLHAMGTTTNSVDLMWNASSHTQGIKEYQIFRNNQLITTTTKTSYTNSGLKSDTAYTYYVKAVSKNGQISEASNVLNVRTQKEASKPETPEKPETPGNVKEWDANTVYVGGDKVTYKGIVYTAKYWTRGNRPDTSDHWKTDGAPEWSKEKAYDGGDKVTYKGIVYKAKQWTRGNQPDKSDLWVKN